MSRTRDELERRVPRQSARISPGEERRRLMTFGPEQVSDVDLLALILGGARATERGLMLLREAGGSWGSPTPTRSSSPAFRAWGRYGPPRLPPRWSSGDGWLRWPFPTARTIEGPDDVAAFDRASIGSAPQEQFMGLGLDVRSRLQLVRTVAMGDLAHVHMHPREVFRPRVQAGMHGTILVHNHLSGVAEPSDADPCITRRMEEVGRVIGIPVLDHVIVTRDAVASIIERVWEPLDEWAHAAGSGSTKSGP